MKRILTMCLILTLTIATCLPTFATVSSTENEIIFTDIDKSHYAYDAIKTMKAYGIISGYPDGTFRPQNTVNRVEFATMMVKALKLEINNHVGSSFEDMSSEKWAIPYVEAAKTYLTGYKNGSSYSFKPLNPSVREDMAVALIKALGKPMDSDSILSSYADGSSVSANLRSYVAAAIQNNLMVGETIGNQKYFYPQRTLTRAEAASLLMNVIREEKITFDEKVTFDNSNNTIDNTKIQNFKLEKNGNGALVLNWSKIDSKDLQGYKVVASLNNPTPKYPDDGYAFWITDKNKTNALIKAGTKYNGGDFSKFEAGKTYYFSITAVYKDKKVPSNVLRETIPSNPSTNDSKNESKKDKNIKLAYVRDGESIKLSWTPSTSESFSGYKIVASTSDKTPAYPENGYFKYITNRAETNALISIGNSYNSGDFKNFEKGKTYYFTITYLYENEKQTTNVLKVEF